MEVAKDLYQFDKHNTKQDQQEMANKNKIDTLGKLDKLQQSTIRELDFYNNRQTELNQKLQEQQRVLKAVQNDINKREELLNFVFDHRQDEAEGKKMA